MYSKETYEEIKKRILDSITIDIDKREGSFINDMISPLAVELTKTYIEFNNIINIAFVESSYDKYLDMKVNEFGIFRKDGDRSRGILKITGTDGVIIPKGTIALTDDGLRFSLESGVIEEGQALIIATAEEIERKYNVLANRIKRLEIDIFGVNSVINENEFSGGIDRETDDELKYRFFNTIRKPQTSGNIYHYEQWALEVDGVGNAIVKPLWNGAGTVKVLISDSNKQPVSEDIINKCREHIESVRPIGATVTISTPTLFDISVSVDVDLDNTKELEEVKGYIKESLIKYFKTCSNKVVFTKVGGVISNTEGVSDYRNLTINEGKSNVSIPEENIINLSSLVVS